MIEAVIRKDPADSWSPTRLLAFKPTVVIAAVEGYFHAGMPNLFILNSAITESRNTVAIIFEDSNLKISPLMLLENDLHAQNDQEYVWIGSTIIYNRILQNMSSIQ